MWQNGVGFSTWLEGLAAVSSFSRLPLCPHNVVQDEFEDLSFNLHFGVNLTI